MAREGSPGHQAQFGTLDPGLVTDPLAYLAAEHARQRALLGHLERLAGERTRPRIPMARALGAWFACELPLHLRDEEESIYPRLQEGARDLTLSLVAENLAMAELRDGIRAALAAIASGGRAPEGFAAAALEFVARYRRHLAVEERNVMPWAASSLDGAERARIVQEMMARRGHGESHA
jgi:hemerythrin-like domain-containing protein